MRKLSEQEQFWASEFGDEYISRNSLEALIGPDIAMWSDILKNCSQLPETAFEMGCNIGANLYALKCIIPNIKISGVEINTKAAALAKKNTGASIYNCSILDFGQDSNFFDLVFSCGVMIHINPEQLPAIYQKLYQLSQRYILINEYYNPSPVAIPYRNHQNKLFKRDFAGELLDMFPDLQLVAYNFIYHRDAAFPKDDCTWFLLEKTK
ncbi:pseudaminic acid biosynthesis-associated methylase [Desulfovibrio sp. ZJ369]|uniref:pseudaminic acid biosynthesis-associated methylase n=1 Tax=Desulfovibrio sp. ZJ369 TaxID=2709793 RepID=UPI0013ED0283|nr:pseudaminic acid biosynthesis-associated methylase [Desulfovibrio sp. ZJ369]